MHQQNSLDVPEVNSDDVVRVSVGLGGNSNSKSDCRNVVFALKYHDQMMMAFKEFH